MAENYDNGDEDDDADNDGLRQKVISKTMRMMMGWGRNYDEDEDDDDDDADDDNGLRRLPQIPDPESLPCHKEDVQASSSFCCGNINS